MRKGYKATNNFYCKNHKFEIGQIYELPNQPRICEYGFHYCVKLIDVLEYYPINHKFHLLEIEDLSSDTVTIGNKSVTNRIRIIREIPKEEYYQLMGFVGNELTIKNENDDWEKHQYDEFNNLLYFEDNNGDWVKHQFDEKNNLIFYETNSGYWEKYQYDERNNWIYWENNSGYWGSYQHDENNQVINTYSGKKSNIQV